MPVVLRVLAVAGRGEVQQPCFVASYDVEAHDGRGDVAWTAQPEEALRFPDAGAALQAWRSQSSSRPLREDGLPNRPLTALTIEIEDAP